MYSLSLMAWELGYVFRFKTGGGPGAPPEKLYYPSA